MVRAVPIAVLKPMIGATEAVSKTLLGLQNTLDPNIREENEAKNKVMFVAKRALDREVKTKTAVPANPASNAPSISPRRASDGLTRISYQV